ncbi:type II toxin-antitoxin system death-on-curing family toxin [Candidatus Uhrbacteria bacterium]|nr:type II toxin-antitoxin system death-on-curing family toxin [Candidatus Uhrbacteria bacterium]
MSHFLTLEDIRDICYVYAKAHLTHDEPIPSFDTRYPEKLEAVLASPQTQIGGRFVHSSMSRQAAVLFYEMIKQHPFLNGNKRIACVSLMVFLSLNDMWLKTNWRELYDIAITVATSRSDNREGMLQLLTDFIQNNAIEK